MYFLLHLPLHKRQALSPIEEKPIQQRESAAHAAPKGASAHAAPKGTSAHAASQELLRTAALKGNRRVRKRNPPHTETERSP